MKENLTSGINATNDEKKTNGSYKSNNSRFSLNINALLRHF